MLVYFFLIILSNYPVNGTINILNDTDTQSARKCILATVDNYFKTYPTISLFTISSESNVILRDLFLSENYVIKVHNFSSYKFNFYDKYKGYGIVIGNSLRDFLISKQIDQLSLWNARAKYIFYTFTNSEYLLKEFVDLVWSYYLINVLIFMPSLNNPKVMKIFSWFPYAEEFCGEKFLLQLVDECNDGVFVKNVNLYPVKVPLDLHHCPVIVRVLIWPPAVLAPLDRKIVDNVFLNITGGIEVEMIKAVAKVANFTVFFTASTVPHDWGLATVDGNTTGTIKALREKKADIGMGSFGPTTERRMYCDYSDCHQLEALAWCVSKADKAPSWKNILLVFTLNAWLSMFFSYFVISIIIWTFANCAPKEKVAYYDLNNTLIYIFSTSLGLTTNKIPEKLSVKILFWFWLIFGFHFIVAYQSKLIGFILRPIYNPQIESLEEILLGGMEFQLLPTQKRMYSNTDDWRVAKINNEWRNCFDSDACLHRVSFDKNFALSTIKSHAIYESLEYLDAEGQPKIYFIDYLMYTCELYMTKGFPFKDRINQIIYRVRNSGLMFKWQKDIQRNRLFKYRKKLVIVQHEQVLTMSHMQGAFGILTIGFIISIVTFLFELLLYKLKPTNLKHL